MITYAFNVFFPIRTNQESAYLVSRKMISNIPVNEKQVLLLVIILLSD